MTLIIITWQNRQSKHQLIWPHQWRVNQLEQQPRINSEFLLVLCILASRLAQPVQPRSQISAYAIWIVYFNHTWFIYNQTRLLNTISGGFLLWVGWFGRRTFVVFWTISAQISGESKVFDFLHIWLAACPVDLDIDWLLLTFNPLWFTLFWLYHHKM